ncbi:MAG: tetratricopeptide repeat protein [bacterium]
MNKIKFTTILMLILFLSSCSNSNKESSEFFKSGTAKFASGNYKEAIAELDKALEINPKLPKAYCFRGSAKYLSGNVNGAIADFNNAIKLDPKDNLSYYRRGLAKYDIGDKNGARLDLEKADKLGNFDAKSMIEAYFKKDK